jgi:hypothetical protein
MPRKKPILDWLENLTDKTKTWILYHGKHELPRRRLYRNSNRHLDGSTGKRNMDVGIAAGHSDGSNNERKSDWTQIRVAGELQRNTVEDERFARVTNLATYVREIFHAQNRKFVLGFTLCGSMMRLWLFGRSGFWVFLL